MKDLRDKARNDGFMLTAVVVVLALYYLLPWLAVSWCVLLVLLVLAWQRLDLVLASLPLTFPFWFVPKHLTQHAVLPLSEIVLALCVAVYVARHAVNYFISRRPLNLALDVRAVWRVASWQLWLATAALLEAGALGVLVARRPHEALRDFRWEIAEPVVYLVLLLGHQRAPWLWRRTLGAFLASAALLAALAAFQVLVAHVTFAPFAAGNTLVPLHRDPGGMYRATGLIYGSGNTLGAYLERALPLAAAFAILPTAMTGNPPRRRATSAVLWLVYVTTLYWSASRGAWVGATVGVLAVAAAFAWHTRLGDAMRHLSRRRLAAATTGIVGVAAVAALVWGRELFSAALAGHNGSGAMRGLLWLAAWHMIRDHPILGIGMDQFLYYYSPHFSAHPYWVTWLSGHVTIAWREPDLSHPHNLVLDLWLSVGMLGLAAVIVVLASFFRVCARLWLDARPSSGRRSITGTSAIGIGAGAAMLASLVHGMVDSAYFEPDFALIFWWLLAIVLLARADAQRATTDGEATRRQTSADTRAPGG